jgi:hypothetical protein
MGAKARHSKTGPWAQPNTCEGCNYLLWYEAANLLQVDTYWKGWFGMHAVVCANETEIRMGLPLCFHHWQNAKSPRCCLGHNLRCCDGSDTSSWGLGAFLCKKKMKNWVLISNLTSQLLSKEHKSLALGSRVKDQPPIAIDSCLPLHYYIQH